MRKIGLIFILFSIFIINNSSGMSFESSIDPNIETASSGPIFWKDEESGVRFRLVTVLSEVHLKVFIQKIEYGEETCCAIITKTYEIDTEKLEGKYALHSVTEIRWIDYDTLQLRANSTLYTIRNLDGEYECISHDTDTVN